MTMSVVGLTLGKRREGDPAGDREGGEGGDEGDDLRGRPRALIPGEAAEQDGAEDEEAGQLPAHRGRSRSSAAAPCSAVITPGRSRMRATSVAKYQPPERISAALPSAITTPSPSSTTRCGEGGGELDVVGGDEDAGAAAGEALDQLDQIALARPIHAASRLVQRDEARQLVALDAAGQGDRQGQPLALAAGEVARVGFDRVLQADDPQRGQPLVARQLVAHSLPDQVVAGVLRQQGDLAWDCRLAPNRLDEACQRSQQGALAGAVAAHQGDSLAALDSQVDALQYVVGLVSLTQLYPEVAHLGGGHDRTAPLRMARASRTPTGRGSIPAREKRRAAGVSKAASAC